MSGLSSKVRTGDAAREALVAYFQRGYTLSYIGRGDIGGLVAGLVKFMEEREFVIAPAPYRAPARRGNRKPEPYKGEAMIGKTHVGKLAQSV